MCVFVYRNDNLLIISTVYPNGQYLRPTYFTHHNLCTMLCERLYAGDTPTNLFPSIHVYNSLGIYLAVTHNKKLRKKQAGLSPDTDSDGQHHSGNDVYQTAFFL